MKKNQKGFTLIELLAVIVILAIIALIAVPIVLNIIEKARKGAVKASGIAFVKATETYLAASQLDKDMKEENKLKKDTEYKVNNIKHLIQIKGDKPSGGEIKIGSKNEVESARLIINGYVVKYDGKEYKLLGKAENIPETYSNITFKESNLEVGAGETITLNPILVPSDVQDGTIIWSSSDESIAKVSKYGEVTGMKKGTVTITAKLKNNVEATISMKVRAGCVVSDKLATKQFLSDVVEVGDYVAYDAGEWKESKAIPTDSGQAGGYEIGESKGKSVLCRSDDGITSLNGWRVLNVNKTTRVVTLVHAGLPVCFAATVRNPDIDLTKLNDEANNFLDTGLAGYAESAHILTRQEASTITGNDDVTNNDLRTLTPGVWYYLASKELYNGFLGTYQLDWVSKNGQVSPGGNSNKMGIRPVVVLKATIKTEGKGKDEFGQAAWCLKS